MRLTAIFPRRRPVKKSPPASVYLQVEHLEDRTVMDAASALPYAASQILVRFRPDVTDLSGLAILPDSRIGRAIHLVPGLRVVGLPEGISVEAALAAFRSNPNVLYAEPDYLLNIDAPVTPDDILFGQQWDMQNTGQLFGTADADIDGPEAWGITQGTGATIVAVIDTGVDYNHIDFLHSDGMTTNIWTNAAEAAGLPGFDDDDNGYIDDIHGYDFFAGKGDPLDDNGHGTHVSGTIGAVGNNLVGVAGVNWNVKIMALKFLSAAGAGATSDAITALDYAVMMGAKVSNNSYSNEGLFCEGGEFIQSFYDAIQSARGAGHIFVAAAGNCGLNTDGSAKSYPASFNLDNIISVAATDRFDDLAFFSNYGKNTVDLGAPGVEILSTYTGNTYNLLDGTSMASPHVAGVVSLVRDLHPTWTYAQVINQVLNTVDPLESLQGRTATGGRLNAAKAVGQATSSAPSISINDVAKNERNKGNTSFTFAVSLSAAGGQTVTVAYATADGTATATGGDYAPKSGTLTFKSGQRTKSIAVSVKGDKTPEPNETFFVNLSNPTNATLGDSQGVGAIVNDDGGSAASSGSSTSSLAESLLSSSPPFESQVLADKPIAAEAQDTSGQESSTNRANIDKFFASFDPEELSIVSYPVLDSTLRDWTLGSVSREDLAVLAAF